MTTEPATAPRCSIARSLEVLGDKWTLLVVREAFWGATRFSEFRDRLAVSSDILASRLATLVDYGVLEKRSYQDEGSRERPSYHLTPEGRELRVVLASLSEWGDRNRPHPDGPLSEYRRADDGRPVSLFFVDPDGVLLGPESVVSVRGTRLRDAGVDAN